MISVLSSNQRTWLVNLAILKITFTIGKVKHSIIGYYLKR